MQTGNRQFWDLQALAKIQCAKTMIFCFLFHSVRREGIVEIVKWDSYLEKMGIFFVREYSARLRNS